MLFLAPLFAASLLLLLGSLLFSEAMFPTGWIRIPLAVFLFTLAILLIHFSPQVFKHPPSKAPARSTDWFNHLLARFPTSLAKEQLPELRTYLADGDLESARTSIARMLEQNSNDCVLLWLYGDTLIAMNDPAAAEAAADRLLASLKSSISSPQAESGLFFDAARRKIFATMLQNDGRFENECTAFLRNIIAEHDKIALLDQLACYPLFEDCPHLFPSAEFCIRKALEIAPANLTLKGTLGALLTERRQFDEAGPLLRACHESGAKHDYAITSYYLALHAENSGDLQQARKLAKQSMSLYPELWLARKANILLERISRS